MALLPVLEFPDPRLRKIARSVAAVDDRVRAVIDAMAETMYAANGIGLAATQVDIHRRIIVLDISETRDQLQVFINPEFTVLNAEIYRYKEGCLSVPTFYEEIERPKHIHVRALNRQGQRFELQPEGLLAVCIQHEIDHLNGKLFVDHLSAFKRNRIKNKLQKRHRQALR